MRKYRSSEAGKNKTRLNAKIQRLLLQKCLAYIRKKDPILLETWRIQIRREVLSEHRNNCRSDADR